MGFEIEQFTLSDQASNKNWFDILETVLEIRRYHQSQVDPCEFYRK